MSYLPAWYYHQNQPRTSRYKYTTYTMDLSWEFGKFFPTKLGPPAIHPTPGPPFPGGLLGGNFWSTVRLECWVGLDTEIWHPQNVLFPKSGKTRLGLLWPNLTLQKIILYDKKSESNTVFQNQYTIYIYIYISEKNKCPFFAPLFESSLMHSDCKNKTVEIMFRDSKMQYRTPLEKHIRATGIPDIYRTLHSFLPLQKNPYQQQRNQYLHYQHHQHPHIIVIVIVIMIMIMIIIIIIIMIIIINNCCSSTYLTWTLSLG